TPVLDRVVQDRDDTLGVRLHPRHHPQRVQDVRPRLAGLMSLVGLDRQGDGPLQQSRRVPLLNLHRSFSSRRLPRCRTLSVAILTNKLILGRQFPTQCCRYPGLPSPPDARPASNPSQGVQSVPTNARFAFAVEFVSDIDAAKRFYIDVLGLAVERDSPTFVQFKDAAGANYAISND